MNNSIFVLIDENYDNFTKTFKIIADYIKNNYDKIVFLSIQELADKMEVSISSISRFCKELGYSGYITFQKDLQKLIQKDIAPMKEIKKSISDVSKEDDILKQTIEMNIKNLQTMYSENLKKDFEKAVNLINKGKRIFIVATRSSFTVSYYLHFMLERFMDNTVLITPGNMDVYDKISSITKEDVLISISFSRYTKFTNDITQFFKNKGCEIISITDSYSSPVATKSNCILLLKNGSYTYSFTTVLTALNALVTAVGAKDKKNTFEKMELKEKNCFDNGIYV
ncbi:MurR/RpiR family transcriptional regulator [Clostridium rectalis]|uniref:MurR/RpiR family transcriptional regulator n=1 Tax=Clostridium rectalis TaxID=2040295 RepID=UPI0013DDC826|nr:MurR/RpiR family transcriptional regulator [Clostridium rectalis]